ncbi:MAG: hypothetical protein FWF94_05165 [Oscillospiraceae bacterium]|nr:hypothetical protein [Oscillospiraceae bacterium]
MLILCERCANSVKNHDRNVIISEIENDRKTHVCEWCNRGDCDMFSVKFPADYGDEI